MYEDDMENHVSLNRVPPKFLALIINFKNAKKVRELVHNQLLAGAESAFAFVLSQHPSLDLMAIANADGDISQFYPAVKITTSIVIDWLEDNTEVDDPVGIPQE
jgi:hypothetical protein